MRAISIFFGVLFFLGVVISFPTVYIKMVTLPTSPEELRTEAVYYFLFFVMLALAGIGAMAFATGLRRNGTAKKER